jgi:hypothetical protein
MFPQAVRGKIIMVLGCDFQVSGIPEIYDIAEILLKTSLYSIEYITMNVLPDS